MKAKHAQGLREKTKAIYPSANFKTEYETIHVSWFESSTSTFYSFYAKTIWQK